MAEGDFTWHNTAKKKFQDGDIDLLVDTLRVTLLNGWTPNIDTDEYWDDISANEISATGYTAGGATLGTKSTAVDTTNDRSEFDAADVTWTSLATATITRAALIHWTGTPSTSTIIGSWEIATNSNGGNYTLQFNAQGVLHFT